MLSPVSPLRGSFVTVMSSTILAARKAGIRAALRANRIQAARSYSAPPVSYKEDHDPQLGDYPVLPYVNRQRLPARGWDDWQMRRNFGDPVSSPSRMLWHCV